MSAMQRPKTLVVVYSRTGTTSKIGAEIARRCGGDLEELRDVGSRRGIFGFLRSAMEANRKVAAKIQTPVKPWRDYDIVVLGTPVWAGHLSSPMRGYLSTERKAPKRIAFFCTMGGRGAEAVFGEFTELTHAAPVATLALTEAQIRRGEYGDAVSSFARKVSGLDGVNDRSGADNFELAGAH